MRLIILIMGLLCSLNTIGQTPWGRILNPIYGSVFQGTPTGSVDVNIQVLNPNNSIDYRVTLVQFDRLPNGGTLSFSYPSAYYDKPLLNATIFQTQTSVISNNNYKNYRASFLELPKKQYFLVLHVGAYQGGFPLLFGVVHQVPFGIGDVYFIAGQSNASGVNASPKGKWFDPLNIENRRAQHDFSGTNDPTVPFTPNGLSYSLIPARTYNYNGGFDYWASNFDGTGGTIPNGYDLDSYKTKSRAFNIFSPQNGNYFGLPYNFKYNQFNDGTDKVNDPIHIFPNGKASWYWSRLGNKISYINGIPTLYFNTAVPGSSLIQGWTNSDGTIQNSPDFQKKLLETLGMFGSAHGVKAILWHHGEEEALRASTTSLEPSKISLDDYPSRLNNLINNTRTYLGDQSNKNIAWYVSNVSLFTDVAANIKNFGSNTGISAATPVSTVPGITLYSHFYTNSNLKAKQSSVFSSTNKVYAGVTDADNITDNSRDDKYKIHFSGDKLVNSVNTMEEMANRWYTAIYNNYNNYTGMAPSTMINFSSVEYKSNGNIKLTYPAGYSNYYFVKNQDGVYNGTVPGVNYNVKSYKDGIIGTPNSYEYTPSEYLLGTVLSCYIKVGNKYIPGQPFYVVPAGGVAPTNKVLEVSNSQMNISPNAQTVNNNIYSENVAWQIGSKPTWVSSISTLGSSGDNGVAINFTQNTGTARVGQIVLQETNGNLTKTININQQGNTTPVATSLTTLTPSSTTGWIQYNKSISQNTMSIAGTQYFQGYGVHPYSNLSFNIGGQYQTFTGKVGHDDGAPCGDGMIFSIIADGTTLFTSPITLAGTAAQTFSVNVNGKNTLELRMTQVGGDICDHGNWVNLYLNTSGVCSTPPVAPTGVTANPSTITAGQSSTLSASCALGTVNWSTGAVANSIVVNPSSTANYTAKCVSTGCPDSPLVGVNITVNTGTTPCSVITDNLFLGTWTPGIISYPLYARYFNNGFWLTQRLATNPERFVVRSSYMLSRNDVALANSTFNTKVNCFAYTSQGSYGGLEPPLATQFPTPAGFTATNEPDGTPSFTGVGNCANPPTAPTNLIANPTSIVSGTNSTLSASCAIGTPLWSTGATTAQITVGPIATTTYTVKCVSSGCSDSPAGSITLNLCGTGTLSHNLVMGSWTVTGHPLVAKFYNNKWWLVQRIATNPEKFVIRGSQMLSRSDVTLTNSTYATLQGCFAWVNSDLQGLYGPPAGIFVTPTGWSVAPEAPPTNLTPVYTSTGGARLSSDFLTLEEASPEKMSLIPNPNTGDFVIKAYSKEAGSASIDLISSTGQLYQSVKADLKVGLNEIPFKTNKISAGQYIVRLKINNLIQTAVVVVQ